MAVEQSADAADKRVALTAPTPSRRHTDQFRLGSWFQVEKFT